MREKTRVALVTGATSGIGRAVAGRLHEAGYRVVVSGRDGELAGKVAAELGGEATGVALDVTDDASTRAAAELVGPVDVLVNNAGVFPGLGELPSTVPLELAAEALAVNALGAWRVSQAFVPGMVRRGWGRVVMVSSPVGALGALFVRGPAYSVSKAALNAVTVLLAAETADTGVLVNAVYPREAKTRLFPYTDRTADEAATDVAAIAMLPDGGPSGRVWREGGPIDW